jgi:hypothetical protein
LLKIQRSAKAGAADKKLTLHAAANDKSGNPGLLLVSALAMTMHFHAVSRPFPASLS